MSMGSKLAHGWMGRNDPDRSGTCLATVVSWPPWEALGRLNGGLDPPLADRGDERYSHTEFMDNSPRAFSKRGGGLTGALKTVSPCNVA